MPTQQLAEVVVLAVGAAVVTNGWPALAGRLRRTISRAISPGDVTDAGALGTAAT